MGTPEILPRSFFSLRADVRQNAHYVTDFQILYPAGAVLILHNFYEKRQRYIKLFEKSSYLEMVTVSPTKKYAAIIENADRGQIIVFDLQTLKKKRTLNLPLDSTTTRFETLAFSHDDKFLIAITGDPDWNMVTYKWIKGIVTNITKAVIPNTSGTVVQVCCSPTDSSELCLIGPGLFRLLTMTETVWKQYGFQRAEQISITTATYLCSDKIACGTTDGKIFFVENGDLKGVYNALTSVTMNVRDKEEYTSSTLTSSSLLIIKAGSSEGIEGEDIAVRTLISFSKGFAYSCKSGLVHFFERESKTKYKKRNVFKIKDIGIGDLQQTELNIVKHLSINISQDKLLATTNRAQLYIVRLWGPDINVAPEILFKHLGEPLHHGSVLDLTMCIWKPYFATLGKVDHTIRLWSYETDTVLIVKYYKEKPLSIDLHPTGNFLAIGFENRLEFSSILINDIKTFRVIPTQNCASCAFSYQGNYAALLNQLSVEVYETNELKHIYTMTGNAGKINCVRWTLNDKNLGTCDTEGNVLIWDMLTGNLLREYTVPGVNMTDFTFSADGKHAYAVGSDGLLREFGRTSEVTKTINLNQSVLDKIVLSRSNLMMFLTGDSSCVMSVKVPITIPPEYTLFHYHFRRITQIKLSFDDQTLITVSEGGSVIVWKLTFAEGKTVIMDKNFIYSTEVLINKSELEEKILTIKDLSQKLYELEMGQARQMRDTENLYIAKIKEIHESYNAAIDELKEKIEQTEHDQNTQLIAMKKEIDDLKEKQTKEKADLIKNYQRRLEVEYAKVVSLDNYKEQVISNFEVMVAELEKAKENETNDIIKHYEDRLAEVENTLKRCHEENIKNIDEHEIVKQHLEEDADREMVETRANFETTLKEEKEQNEILKNETLTMRKRSTEAARERDEYRDREQSLIVELKKYQENIHTLEKDIAELKSEILERDNALVRKDERILNLKKKLQELEKFKFVLDYKVKELKKQISPKDREIKERKEQMADMVVELGNLKKLNSSLELQLVELKEKIVGTEKEILFYEKRNTANFNAYRQIKVDIFSLYQELHDYSKLKERIKSLHYKYYQNDITTKENYGESDLQRELMLQREFLEKTITALRSTLRKNGRNKKDGTKVIKDNVVLLEELNAVRKELKIAVTAVRNLETLIGVTPNKVIVPREALDKMKQALKKQDNIVSFYNERIEKTEKEQEGLGESIKSMQQKVIAAMYVDE